MPSPTSPTPRPLPFLPIPSPWRLVPSVPVRIRTLILLFTLTLVAPLPSSSQPFPPPLNLFSPLANSPAPASQPTLHPTFRAAITFSEIPWKPGLRCVLPLTPTSPPALLTVDSVQHLDDATLAFGHLEGIPGSEVHLVARPLSLAAILRRPGQPTLRLYPSPDPSLFHLDHVPTDIRCANPEFSAPALPPLPPRTLSLSGPHATTTTTTDPVTLDLLVVHTAAAELAAGGPGPFRTLVDLALLESNDAFARSAALTRVRLVHLARVDYEESGDISRDLDRLKRRGDGWLDEVHSLRNTVAADLVCLITEFEETRQFAGMANQLYSRTTSAYENAFTVCLRPYLIGNYTLPHEIGHLHGCNHDRSNAPGGGADPASFGHHLVVNATTYRTVMAYRPGLQIPHFSNPAVSFLGVPTGIDSGPDAAHNVRTLNLSAPGLAAIREPATRVGFTQSTLSVPESIGTLAVNLARTGIGSQGSLRVFSRPGSALPHSDFSPIDLTLAFDPDTSILSLAIPVLDDALPNGPRSFSLHLDSPSPGWTLGPISSLSITLTDDEIDAVAPLDSRFRPQPGADSLVAALAPGPDDSLLAAGAFATFQGQPHPRIVRVLPDGSPDPAFQTSVKYRVHALATLPDSRIALGGEFNTVNGEPFQHLALLQPDGSLDPNFQFQPGTDLPVLAIAPIPNDPHSFWIAGRFTTVRNQSAVRVARLQTNGELHPDFLSRTGPDDEVFALTLDSQQRPYLGGRFQKIAATPRPVIARLLPSGALDPTFQPSLHFNGPVRAIECLAPHRIVVAGEFTRIDQQPVGHLVALTPAGSPDPDFSPGSGADGPILALAPSLETPGALWVAGAFTHFDGQPRRRIARLLPQGALDPAFDPGTGPDDWVLDLLPQPNHSLAIAGLFTHVNGVPRGGLATLLTRPDPPATFRTATLQPNGLLWTADLWPHQPFLLESSPDLRSWQVTDSLLSTNGRASGLNPVHAHPTTFLRLRRLLE